MEASPQIIVYTTQTCPYCRMAKEWFREKGLGFEEVDVTRDPAARARLAEETGRRTVPQIFIGGKSIGGYDDLRALEARGEIDGLLEDSVSGRADGSDGGGDAPREEV